MTPPNNPHYSSTQVVAPDEDGIAAAAALIARGECVAVPTETVYGLAADATNPAGVARIYEAKGRPGFNPLIVHVSSQADAELLADFDDRARGMADRFWPGPLTLVLPRRPDSPIAAAATAGLSSIALRVPAHPAMRALIAATGRPLAAPSANRSGGISPTTAAHVLRSLGGRIPMVLDGGPTKAGLESTIVAITEGSPRLLRPGTITAEELGLDDPAPAGPIEAPGQLASHYKPGKPLILDVVEAQPGMWLIGFDKIEGDASLSRDGDLAQAAASLYARLHEADASAASCIGVAPVPARGVGAAINDRLRRAAAD